MPSTEQKILAVQHQWIEYEIAGDTSGIVSLCVDDVVWLPPDESALRGTNAVAAWLARLPPYQIQRIEIADVQIHQSGGLAYKLADFQTLLEGAETPVRGSHLWILRESTPGQWRVAVVAWSVTRRANLR